MSLPDTLTEDQHGLLTTYLNDHLAGATGALARLRFMFKNYGSKSHHAELRQLEQLIGSDRSRLIRLMDQVGVKRLRSTTFSALVGEWIGRRKPNRRLVRPSPLSPLLEAEVLRAGIVGKQSLWQTVAIHADRLGVDRREFEHLIEDAREQERTMDRIHKTWAGEAFSG